MNTPRYTIPTVGNPLKIIIIRRWNFESDRLAQRRYPLYIIVYYIIYVSYECIQCVYIMDAMTTSRILTYRYNILLQVYLPTYLYRTIRITACCYGIYIPVCKLGSVEDVHEQPTTKRRWNPNDFDGARTESTIKKTKKRVSTKICKFLRLKKKKVSFS